MAYLGENEHKEYLDYVIAQQEEGKEFLSKEAWRKQRKKPEQVSNRDGYQKTILSDGE